MTNQIRFTLERIQQTCQRCGISRAQLYVQIAEGLYPHPIKIGRNSFFPAHETDAIIKARIAGKSDDDIRGLVSDLIVARRTAA
jgi:prophage regulatory protein